LVESTKRSNEKIVEQQPDIRSESAPHSPWVLYVTRR